MRGRTSFPMGLIELALLGAVGCGHAGIGEAGGPVVVAVVEVADAAPVTSGAMMTSGDPKSGSRDGCAYEVESEDVTPSSPTCTIYEEVSKGPGRVTMPCGGADGPVTGTFGEHEYRGEVKGRKVTLEHSYEFEEKDGCRWRVTGRISGSAGATTLAWVYREEILEDDTSNCWATCTARTSLKLTPVR